MHMRIRRKQHHNPIMDQRRMWRTKGIVGLTWEAVMSTGMNGRIATMRMRTMRTMHCKPMMDQHRMWRHQGIVIESVMIRLYISEL